MKSGSVPDHARRVSVEYPIVGGGWITSGRRRMGFAFNGKNFDDWYTYLDANGKNKDPKAYSKSKTA